MEDIGLHRIGQQLEHLARHRRVEVGEHDGGQLRMFVGDHVGDLGRFEPAERFQPAGIVLRRDPGQYAAGFFRAQRAVHHRLDLRLGIEADPGARARLLDEIVEHAADRMFAHVGDGEHRLAELAHFIGIELLEDGRGLLLADQHHQHGGAFDAGIIGSGHQRASALIMSRTASAARAGFSRVKPRTIPTRSS